MTRPRVTALIAAATAAPVTLVVAPAGSGKSRALGDFLAQTEPDRFRVVDGVERLDESAVARLVAEIDRAGAAQRWILATRSTERLPIGTWLAYGRARCVIGPSELNFTALEAREDVVAFTGGWAVATVFACGLAASGADQRAIRERTRDMMRSFLDERLHAEMPDSQRELLEIASVMPAMDVALLERAGFPNAYETLQRIAARTGVVWECETGRFASNDFVLDSLRRRIVMRERVQRSNMYERAGMALERSGLAGEALDAFVASGRHDDVLRLLHGRGLQLLDRAQVDVVQRAVEVLDDRTRRDDPFILTLRGVAHAAKGRPVRAEALLRRALLRADSDKSAHAVATLRLAQLLVNRGEYDGGGLEALAAGEGHAAEARAEAWSILAVQRAASGSAALAKTAIERATELLPSIDRDDARAKILQRVGVAAMNLDDVELARTSLEEAAELATEIKLYSAASKAYSVLFNLARHHYDDVDSLSRFSAGALSVAEKSGDLVDLRSALLQVLNVATRFGKSEEVETLVLRLDRLPNNGRHPYFSEPFKAIWHAWSGNFAEASRLMALRLDQIRLKTDYLTCGALLTLFSECGGQSNSARLLLDGLVRELETHDDDRIFARRQRAVAFLYCAVATSIAQRITIAERLLRRIRQDDPVTTALFKLGGSFLDAARHRGAVSQVEICDPMHELVVAGYGDVASVLDAVSNVIESRIEAERPRLSPAEVSVLQMLNAGLSTKEIAGRSGRSVFTIRAHIANAIGRLGCHGRAEAVATARRLGVID